MKINIYEDFDDRIFIDKAHSFFDKYPLDEMDWFGPDIAALAVMTGDMPVEETLHIIDNPRFSILDENIHAFSFNGEKIEIDIS